MEPFRRDADDRMLNAVQNLGSPDNGRIEIVAIFPGPISDHRDGMRIASSSFFGSKSATEEWFHSECVEIIRRDYSHRCAFGAVADAERRTGDAIDDERLKERGVSFKISEIRIGQPVVLGYAARRADERKHPVLMWHERIRPNQDSFDPTEHCGVCPDAECEAKQRKNRKSGAAQKHPKTEAKILEKRLHQLVI